MPFFFLIIQESSIYSKDLGKHRQIIPLFYPIINISIWTEINVIKEIIFGFMLQRNS